MHKHRILYIHDEGEDVGGGGISILNLVKALDRNRFEPVILCPKNWKFKDDLVKLGIQIFPIWLPSWTKGKSLLFIIPAIIRLIKFLKKETICLIFYCGFMHIPFGFFATKFIRVPSICRLYSYDANKKWHFKFYLVNTVSAYLTPSMFSKCILEKENIDPKKLNVIYHGLPDKNNVISKVEARKLLGLDENAPIILNVGRIVPQKNLETLIRAIPIVKAFIPNINCLIIGEISNKITDKSTHSYYQSLVELVKKIDVQDNVKFLGFKYGEEKSLYFSAMDIFVLPSRFEEFGLVLLEAMSKGRPVVASAEGGIPEIVENGSTGIMVPSLDPLVFADAILGLLNHPEKSERMGIEGRKRFESHFTIQREVQEHERFYESFLKCD